MPDLNKFIDLVCFICTIKWFLDNKSIMSQPYQNQNHIFPETVEWEGKAGIGRCQTDSIGWVLIWVNMNQYL